MKIIFLIREFFKKHNQTEAEKITDAQFMKIQQRNVHMLNYFNGEQNRKSKLEVISTDLENLNSKSLFTCVIFKFNQKVALLNIKNETLGIILIGLNCLIECFKEITFKK